MHAGTATVSARIRRYGTVREPAHTTARERSPPAGPIHPSMSMIKYRAAQQSDRPAITRLHTAGWTDDNLINLYRDWPLLAEVAAGDLAHDAADYTDTGATPAQVRAWLRETHRVHGGDHAHHGTLTLAKEVFAWMAPLPFNADRRVSVLPRTFAAAAGGDHEVALLAWKTRLSHHELADLHARGEVNAERLRILLDLAGPT